MNLVRVEAGLNVSHDSTDQRPYGSNELQRQNMYLMTYTPREDSSDQSVFCIRLIRLFLGRSVDSQGPQSVDSEDSDQSQPSLC